MRHLFTDRRQTPGGQGTFAEGSDRPTFSYMLLRLNLNEIYSNRLPGKCNTLLNFFIRSFLDQGAGSGWGHLRRLRILAWVVFIPLTTSLSQTC